LSGKLFIYLWDFKAKVYEFKQLQLKSQFYDDKNIQGDLKAQMFSLKKNDY